MFKMVESYFLIDKDIFSIRAFSTIHNLFLAIGRILTHIFLVYSLVLLRDPLYTRDELCQNLLLVQF